MGEHSPVDALVPSVVCEYAVVGGVDVGIMLEGEDADGGMEGEEVVGGWERLEWVVDERIEKECHRAEEDARALIADSDDSGLWFTDYGADWIKDVGTSSLTPSLHLSYSPFPAANNLSIYLPRSQTISRRLHSNGTPARLVQNPRRVHSDVRNGLDPYVRAWSHGDDSDFNC